VLVRAVLCASLLAPAPDACIRTQYCQYNYILVCMITYYYVCNQLLPILVEKTVKLSGLWREIQCILSTQSEIGLFPAGEGSL